MDSEDIRKDKERIESRRSDSRRSPSRGESPARSSAKSSVRSSTAPESTTETFHYKKRAIKDEEKSEDEVEESLSKNRRRWITLSRIGTFYVPDFLLSCCKKSQEAKQAWREKTSIFTFMVLISAIILIISVLVPRYSCEQPAVYRWIEINKINNKESFMILDGYILDVKPLISIHPTAPRVMASHLGTDVSQFFERAPLEVIPPKCGLQNLTDYELFQKRCSFVNSTLDESEQHCHQWIYPPNSTYYRAKLAYTWADLALLNREQHWFVIDNRVYNTTDYYNQQMKLDPDFDALVYNRDKTDATYLYYNIFQNKEYKECFDLLFYAGIIDTRNYTRCFVANICLFLVLIAVCLLIVIKFIAALFTIGYSPFRIKKKYVIINVPCYTEDHESMYKTINSAAKTSYSNKHKLLFIVCDGMITGKGNHKSTPEIVLDILCKNVDDCLDTYSYHSLSGPNRAKVYTGEFKDVPFMVVVKCGTPDEKSRPGNRGKRDSQVILLSYLNKIFYKGTFNELEEKIDVELRENLKLDPSAYEYLMTIDADTKVDVDSVSHLVYRMDSDRDIIAGCGETRVGNTHDSWVTVMQVYEYYVNHHLNKAFESIFSSVTCLPGCFSIYRIKFVPKGRGRVKPGIILTEILASYSNRNVTSLHTKNLLNLGEDRFFSTLLLRFFPKKKTKFFHEAISYTSVPSSWTVLLSQRRRWINSTIHNQFELMSIPTLKGIACFSIKTVILIDLITVFLLPMSLFYLGYLLYTIFTFNTIFPIILIVSLSIMLGAQVLIIVFKQDWKYMIWFFIYLLSIPIWFIIVPIYAILKMDDVSWGSTRLVQNSPTIVRKRSDSAAEHAKPETKPEEITISIH